MTFAQYLHVLRRQWLIVALLTVLCAALASAYTARQTPTYPARSQLFVSVHPTGASGSDIGRLSQGSAFVQQRVTSYAAIVTSPEVLALVIRDLGLTLDASALAARVSVQNPPDTVLLDITVSDSDPDRAAAVANGIAEHFPGFVNAIETPQPTGRSPVTLTPTVTATPADSPSAPRGHLNLALGVLLGLGLGCGAAVLRDRLNTTLSTAADVETVTGATPLGVVPYDPTASRQPLVDTQPHGARAEAFRTLRTNLRFADVDHPPRVIVITSPLPAEGKTTTACNLALTLAMNGSRVILVDGDLRKPSIGSYLGISSAVGLTSVLAGRYELRDVLVDHGRHPLTVLPAGPLPPNPSELLGSQHMSDLLTALADHYDAVVVDAPPLLPVTDAAVLAALADGTIVVFRNGRTRREDAARAMQSLAAVGARLLGSTLNFVPRARTGEPDGYGYQIDLTDSGVAGSSAPAKGNTPRRGSAPDRSSDS